MSKLFLNLRNVPEDEADEVRDLLTRHAIAFYETEPSSWGISAGGIWLREADQLPRAKALMADYQQQRRARALEDRAAAEREGRGETFLGLLKTRPLYVLGMLAAIVLVLGLTLALPYLLL